MNHFNVIFMVKRKLDNNNKVKLIIETLDWNVLGNHISHFVRKIC